MLGLITVKSRDCNRSFALPLGESGEVHADSRSAVLKNLRRLFSAPAIACIIPAGRLDFSKLYHAEQRHPS